MRRGAFAACALTIGVVVIVQSIAHLAVVLGADRIGTILDLDRSNGLPDIVSTVVLGIAATGAANLFRRAEGIRRLASGATSVALSALTLADVLHDGAHPSGDTGRLVIALVVCTIGLLAILAVESGVRGRMTLAVGVGFLAASFLATGLDRFDQRFQRERGEPLAEFQIVAKEGLELAGWALVALALWDQSLRQRAPRDREHCAGGREPTSAPTTISSRTQAVSARTSDSNRRMP